MTLFVKTPFVPAKDDSRLDLPVEKIPGISTRGAKALREDGITTVREVVGCSMLRAVPKLGDREVKHIIEGLSELFDEDLTEGTSREERKEIDRLIAEHKKKR